MMVTRLAWMAHKLIGVLKQTNKVRLGLASFLKSHHRGTLETQIGLEILSDFSHKTLEGQLADQQLGGFLVTTDLTKSDCTRAGGEVLNKV